MTNKIILITGCMFSGKTTELIKKLDENNSKLIKPARDDRYNRSKVVTHNGLSMSTQVVNSIEEIGCKNKKIGIDEINLFDQNTQRIINQIRRLSEENDVIISGLDKDFKGDPFQPVPRIKDISDKTIIKKATCEKCGGKATMTQRLIKGEPAPKDSPLYLVGGSDSYEARCKNCHKVK
jgi:thymidine kinase